MNKIIKKVENLLDAYGHVIQNDKQLLLLYWQKIDGINITKESIPTKEFIEKATMPNVILDAKMMIEIREGMKNDH
jgi:hypothetical protein